MFSRGKRGEKKKEKRRSKKVKLDGGKNINVGSRPFSSSHL